MPVGEKALVSGEGDQGGQGFFLGVAEWFQVEQVVVIGHIQLVTLAPPDLPQVGVEAGDDPPKGEVAAQVGDDRPERLSSLGFNRYTLLLSVLAKVIDSGLGWRSPV